MSENNFALFNESEAELISAARMVLSDGVRRLTEREGLFPTNKARGRSARAEVIAAREGLVSYLVATYGPLRHEVAVCCLIDAQGRLIAVNEFPHGKTTHCEIDFRIFARMIVDSGAVAVVLAHNHPSGDNTPSRQDENLTHHIGQWLAPMDVRLIDHLVVSCDGASAIIGDL